MLCQICNKRTATVQIINIINGVKTVLNVCEHCAAEAALGSVSSIDLNSLINQLFNIEGNNNIQNHPSSKACPECSTTLEEFMQNGKLGCDKCYDTFADVLEPIIKRLHGTTQHVGKISASGGRELQIKKEISEIQKKLDDAVSKEEYELAAQYRDLIKLLKQPSDISPEETQ